MYTYVHGCMCIRWHLKETALQGTITWSEMGKLNIQYWLKKVYWVHCTKRKAIRSGCWNCILSNMQDILNKDPTPFKQSLSWVCQNLASERKDLHFIYLVDKVHLASWSPTFQTKGTSIIVHEVHVIYVLYKNMTVETGGKVLASWGQVWKGR